MSGEEIDADLLPIADSGALPTPMAHEQLDRRLTYETDGKRRAANISATRPWGLSLLHAAAADQQERDARSGSARVLANGIAGRERIIDLLAAGLDVTADTARRWQTSGIPTPALRGWAFKLIQDAEEGERAHIRAAARDRYLLRYGGTDE